MVQTKVADLTVEELRLLIKDTVTQTLREALADPDQGLDLHPKMEQEIQQSLAYTEAGGTVATAEDVAARLGLEW